MQQPNFTQCPMCFLPYDDKERLPYDICKESHSMCLMCLMKIKNSQHTNCFVCRNPLEERVNRLAQNLLRIIRTMSVNAIPKPPVANNGNKSAASNSREASPSRDSDSSMVRTAFFPNPNEFNESLNQAPPQAPNSGKMIGLPSSPLPPTVPLQAQQHHNLQVQEHYKAASDRLLLLQTQLNEVNGKYQQLVTKNAQQSPNQQLVQLQKQYVALQQEIEKQKRYQQELFIQLNKNVNPMPHMGSDQVLFGSFGLQQQPQNKPTSAIKAQGQGQQSLKQVYKKPQNVIPQTTVVPSGQNLPPQPVQSSPVPSGKMLPTANDARIPNLPSQQVPK